MLEIQIQQIQTITQLNSIYFLKFNIKQNSYTSIQQQIKPLRALSKSQDPQISLALPLKPTPTNKHYSEHKILYLHGRVSIGILKIKYANKWILGLSFNTSIFVYLTLVTYLLESGQILVVPKILTLKLFEFWNSFWITFGKNTKMKIGKMKKGINR